MRQSAFAPDSPRRAAHGAPPCRSTIATPRTKSICPSAVRRWRQRPTVDCRGLVSGRCGPPRHSGHTLQPGHAGLEPPASHRRARAASRGVEYSRHHGGSPGAPHRRVVSGSRRSQRHICGAQRWRRVADPAAARSTCAARQRHQSATRRRRRGQCHRGLAAARRPPHRHLCRLLATGGAALAARAAR